MSEAQIIIALLMKLKQLCSCYFKTHKNDEQSVGLWKNVTVERYRFCTLQYCEPFCSFLVLLRFRANVWNFQRKTTLFVTRLFFQFCNGLEIAPHRNKVVIDRWYPRVTSHCDRHHKRKSKFTYQYLCNLVLVEWSRCVISSVVV